MMLEDLDDGNKVSKTSQVKPLANSSGRELQ